MENIQQKADFLRTGFIKALSQLTVDTPHKWGKMNALQMIEHMCDYVRIASGKTLHEVISPEEIRPRLRDFLASEKPFRENTANVLMPDTPEPAKHETIQDAISELQQEINHFFEVHENETGRTTPNPFFGHLNYEQQVQLLFKHATHHLRQFGIVV